jgi:hypothetical protein
MWDWCRVEVAHPRSGWGVADAASERKTHATEANEARTNSSRLVGHAHSRRRPLGDGSGRPAGPRAGEYGIRALAYGRTVDSAVRRRTPLSRVEGKHTAKGHKRDRQFTGCHVPSVVEALFAIPCLGRPPPQQVGHHLSRRGPE